MLHICVCTYTFHPREPVIKPFQARILHKTLYLRGIHGIFILVSNTRVAA